jgi:hypothetical protein
VDGQQWPQEENRFVPAKSTRSISTEMGRTSEAMQVTSDRQTGVPGKGKPATVTQHPPSRQQRGVSITPTGSRHSIDFPQQEGKASARAFEPGRRSAPQRQHTAIHIGTIDIHVVPPSSSAPLPPTRSTTARPRSTLSREMTSSIGLRQG